MKSLSFLQRKKHGLAMVMASVFFTMISLLLVLTVSSPAVRQVRSASDFARSRGALFAAQALTEDIIYRLMTGKNVPATLSLQLNEFTASATTTSVASGREILVEGSFNGHRRNIKTHVSMGSGVAFHYGTQSGEGGMILNNSSSVHGNVFSNGPIVGSGSNLIRGDVVSAGPSGSIDSVHATSSAYAHTIRDTTIDGDAHYQSISNSTVGGNLYSGSPDQATSSLPITDAMVAEWEAEAEAGGVHTSPCPYSISGSVTLGPRKINCDLTVSGSAVITLTGPVWVVGNITISNTADIRVSSTLGSQSAVMIAHNPSNETGSGRITVTNSVEFFGSGSAGSYVLLLSQNRSAEQGGSTSAIAISNTVQGALLLYAGHGLVQMSNSVNLREVTAYKIVLSNTASIRYETGLANMLFSAGPSGGYEFDAWREVE